ncbi:MAG: alpha/beta hydrolase family protein [Phycisphaeraceae bacterium]
MRYTGMTITPPPVVLRVFALLLLACALPNAALAEPYKPDAGPYKVDTFLLELHDAKRDRAVPVKVYRPVGADGRRPIVLVSHGLGGTREGLSYLGKHWASHGYVCVHMQHHGSDDAVWKDAEPSERLAAMRRAALDPSNATRRAGDTTFVLDVLTRMSDDTTSKLFNAVDLDRAGIAGHSFGAWTCLAAGGMTMGGLREVRLNDPRIRCMIPLSPPVVNSEKRYQRTYKTLDIPALFMTGTLDTSVINDTTAEQRLVPYKFMPGPKDGGAPKYQINFDGADHMTFSGETRINRRMRNADPQTDPVFHALILQSTTAFLDCYLLGEETAKQWLNEGAFVKAVGKHGDVEMDVEQ